MRGAPGPVWHVERVRILLVEDERRLARVLARGLGLDGFVVDVANDGRGGFLLARTGGYDAMVLDLMLPGMSGLEVCRALRAEDVVTPILVLTARDAERDEVASLSAGADDYLRKPFRYPVLLARLRSLLRRSPLVGGDVLHVGDLEVDTVRREVRRDGRPVPVTAREFALLEVLARADGAVLSKEAILVAAWPGEADDVNLVEARMSGLRRKVDVAFDRRSLETVRGAGYRLVDDRVPR